MECSRPEADARRPFVSQRLFGVGVRGGVQAVAGTARSAWSAVPLAPLEPPRPKAIGDAEQPERALRMRVDRWAHRRGVHCGEIANFARLHHGGVRAQGSRSLCVATCALPSRPLRYTALCPTDGLRSRVSHSLAVMRRAMRRCNGQTDSESEAVSRVRRQGGMMRSGRECTIGTSKASRVVRGQSRFTTRAPEGSWPGRKGWASMSASARWTAVRTRRQARPARRNATVAPAPCARAPRPHTAARRRRAIACARAERASNRTSGAGQPARPSASDTRSRDRMPVQGSRTTATIASSATPSQWPAATVASAVGTP